MLARHQPLVVIALGSLVLGPGTVACGDKPAPAPAPAPAKAEAKAEAKAPEAKAPEVKAPEVQAPPDEWLVWSRQDGRFSTRWVDGSKPGDGLVAKRKALIVSDGTRMLRVHRDDVEVDVMDYECLERGDDECEVTARLVVPGIAATDLLTKEKTEPRRVPCQGAEADGTPIFGDGISLSLEVVGGVGTGLWIREGEDGYYGGVHGEVSEGTMVFDVASGAAVPIHERLASKVATLPGELRKDAAEELRKNLEDCDDEVPTLPQMLDGDRMGLVGLRATLVDGKPRHAWEFTAETFYACSPDYSVHAEVTSELQTVESLGLEALPPGVLRAMTHLQATRALGWARLSLEGEARTKALAAFQTASEEPWPASETTDRAVVSAPEEHGDAMKLVARGRKATRDKDYETAITAFDDAIALEKDMPSAWSGRGYAKLLAGQLDGAQADLDKAYTLDDGPKYQAMVLYNLGMLAERKGDLEAAKEAYTDSLTLRENKTVRQVLDQLEGK